MEVIPWDDMLLNSKSAGFLRELSNVVTERVTEFLPPDQQMVPTASIDDVGTWH